MTTPRLTRTRSALASGIRHPRLLLAVKTALAVGIAWAIAPHMPGVADDYPYYAPLGALVSMYPTLMSSARTGLQTLLGLATGIALATLVLVTWGPNWFTIPIIVGIGVLVSGLRWFGAGREYVPMAALFVLIIGGPNADAYSLGYLIQMGVGIVVGLLVNVLIMPPLTSQKAAARIDSLQTQLASHLHDIGEALRESWPPEHENWSRNSDSLTETVIAVRQALTESDESRKGNPRALRHKRDTNADHERLEALETVTFHVRDITEVLADSIWQQNESIDLDPDLCPPLSDAVHAVASALDEKGSLDEAQLSLEALAERVYDRTMQAQQALGPAVVASMGLVRILRTLRPAP